MQGQERQVNRDHQGKKAAPNRKAKKENAQKERSNPTNGGNVTKEDDKYVQCQHQHNEYQQGNSMSIKHSSKDVDADVLSFECAAKQRYFYMSEKVTIEQTAMLALYIADHSKLVGMQKLSVSAALSQFDDMLQYLAKDMTNRI